MYSILSILETVLNDFSTKEAADWLDKQIPNILEFGKKLVIAFLIIWLGRKLMKILEKILARSMKRSNLDESVAKFFLSIISVASNVLLIFMAAGLLGLERGSIVALIGSAGLAIGLALQGSLANFAGGVLILLMKPFRIGDYIISNGNEGTVKSIDIFYTRMLTTDNRLVVIPNGILSNSSIINVTNEPIRRLDVQLSINYSENLKLVKDVLWKIGQDNPLRQPGRDTEVVLQAFEPGVITMSLRVWVKTEDYWTLKWELLEEIKDVFEKNNIRIPLAQLELNLSKISKNI